MRTVIVRCPYCLNPNNVEIKSMFPRKEVINCDVDDSPGCGEAFVWSYSITVETKTFELKEFLNEKTDNG